MIKNLFVVFVFLVSLTASQPASAQTACPGPGETREQCEARLNARYQELLNEIKVKETELKQTQAQVGTLKGDINNLNKKIEVSQSKIKSYDVAVKKISSEITVKEQTVRSLDEKSERQKQALSQILRKSNELSNTSIVEFALASASISDFFVDVDSYRSVEEAMEDSFKELKETKSETLEEKEKLEEKKEGELELRTKQVVEKKKIEENKAITNQILKETQGVEQLHQKTLSEKRAEAERIRNALFPLRDAGSIKFGDAYQYAKEAFEVTGVRPAFVLAILTQESNLGQNVGRCLLSNPSTGAGTRVSDGSSLNKVMNPTRDVPQFLLIAQELGFDPYKQRISCPIAGIGWGGAMGPAQFIPSTWNLYKERIRNALGIAPDPWRPRDAIFASSIYLQILGAQSDEKNAACKYYSGQRCANSSGANSYGNSVVSKSKTIQAEINTLQSVQ